MTYSIGDVVEANTADIFETSSGCMVIVRDDRVPEDEWYGFAFNVTKEDLERLQMRERINLKVISVEPSVYVCFAEAPQSPPYLRYYKGQIHVLHPMGFESQNWGRYPWLK